TALRADGSQEQAGHALHPMPSPSIGALVEQLVYGQHPDLEPLGDAELSDLGVVHWVLSLVGIGARLSIEGARCGCGLRRLRQDVAAALAITVGERAWCIGTVRFVKQWSAAATPGSSIAADRMTFSRPLSFRPRE